MGHYVRSLDHAGITDLSILHSQITESFWANSSEVCKIDTAHTMQYTEKDSLPYNAVVFDNHHGLILPYLLYFIPGLICWEESHCASTLELFRCFQAQRLQFGDCKRTLVLNHRSIYVVQLQNAHDCSASYIRVSVL